MAKITMIMPVYNGMPYLPLAVESILNQSLTDWELIIAFSHNPQNDDGGWAYLQSVKHDKRLKILEFDKAYGQTHAMNAAIQVASGQYLGFAMADDISLPTRLAKLSAMLDENPQYILATADIINIDEHGNFKINAKGQYTGWDMPYESQDLIKSKTEIVLQITLIAALWRANFINDFRRAIDYACDYDFILRIMPFGDFGIVHEPLIYYRKHSGAISVSHREKLFMHGCLTVLSYHHRQQGYADFLNQYDDKIDNWQVLFDNIRNDYHAQIMGHLINQFNPHNYSEESWNLIKNNAYKLAPRVITHQGFQILEKQQKPLPYIPISTRLHA